MALEVDVDLLREFERGLDPAQPERSAIPARVLGYGEISTVFQIEGIDLACKRMPIFESEEELVRYHAGFERYNQLLAEIGITVPESGHATVEGRDGSPVVYLLQRRLDPDSIANRAMLGMEPAEVYRLVTSILGELAKLWRFNASHEDVELGIDGQISNWSVVGLEDGRLPDELELLYLDTSTPFVRLDGAEQLDPELFLRSAPSFLIWIVRALFLEDVMTRYYDFHLVAVDLIANFYKEQRPELIGGLVKAANSFFTGEAADLDVAPLTEKEIRSYYREDALIWRLYLGMRRLDRFLRTKVTHKGYRYILPGKIRR
ncbi:MAG: hypothetical protein KKF41_13290 [Actinobacteria bacterium]|nr:hypothetical protein [Actinomycetota bacterium]MBU1944865.1 hypothetical protein [Actinomycetota bacterium]MBU2688551.1 hypothetical protein [Actinomycetota bacterium]